MEGIVMETPRAGAPSPREFHLFDAIAGMITQPVSTLRQIALVRPWPQALVLYIGLAVLQGLTSLTFPRSDFDSGIVGSPAMDSGARAFLDTITTPSFLFGSALVITPLILIIETGILYLVGRLLGGQGPFSGLLSTFAFASVPLLIMAPLTAVLNLGGSALAIGLIRGLVGTVAGIWVLVLQVLAIRESLTLSTGRAIAVFLIPFALVLLLACVGGLLIASLAMRSLNG
ncbi:membrane hypothetical protein [Nitrolancea hollandica Lb]|uniref:Yip1 domain-containing protein n=2 Tax=Nitrolancea hollandica TaxID=1206749 RepID=I4EE24_9BACT|nr:membrane hypothetical protein [Nitrolancea hollandica Lb]